ncbi:MAG: glycosyltransferase family 2 protein [Planctomycetota bacterium]
MNEVDLVPLSVCVATRNRPDLLERGLRSLVDARPCPAQVVVSDDSDDGEEAAAVCASFADESAHTEIKYVRGPRVGLSANRNSCIAEATQPWLLFLDDDAGLFEDSLVHFAELTSEGERVITGLEHNGEPNPRIVEPRETDFWGVQRLMPDLDDLHVIVINATLMPRRIFESVRFDEVLRYGSDEVDIARQARGLGFEIVHKTQFKTWHRPSYSDRQEYSERLATSIVYATLKDKLLIRRNLLGALVYLLLGPAKVTLHRAKRNGCPWRWSGWRALNPMPVVRGLWSLKEARRAWQPAVIER